MAGVTNGELRAALEAADVMLQADPRQVLSSEDQANVRLLLDAHLPEGHKLAALDAAHPSRTLENAPLRKVLRGRLEAVRLMTSGPATDNVTDEHMVRLLTHLAEFFTFGMPAAREVERMLDVHAGRSSGSDSSAAAVAAAAGPQTMHRAYLEAVAANLPEEVRLAAAQGEVLGVAVAFAALGPDQRTPAHFCGLVSALAACLPPVLRPDMGALLNVDARHQSAVQRLVDNVRAADFGKWRGEPRGVAAADFVDGCSVLLVAWVDVASCYRVILGHFRKAVETAAPNLRLDLSVDAPVARAALALDRLPVVERRALQTLLTAVALANAVQWRTMLDEAAVARRDQLKAARLSEADNVAEFVARLVSWQQLAHPSSVFGPRDLVEHLADHQRVAITARFVEAVEALTARLPASEDAQSRAVQLPEGGASLATLGNALAWWRAERAPALEALGQRWSPEKLPLLISVIEEVLARERAATATPAGRGRVGVAALAKPGATTRSRSPSPAAAKSAKPATVVPPNDAPAATSKRGRGPTKPSCVGCGRGHWISECTSLTEVCKAEIVATRQRLAQERDARIAADVAARKEGKPARTPTPGPPGNGRSPRR